LPLSILKVDKSFVFAVLADGSNAAIVQAVVRLALSLGRHIIADAVATAEHAAFLGGLDCDWVQGFDDSP
jgi:EAL domain-containing protein (putative c-di-GMP-specific phosphodiesterase class I)